MLKRFILMSLLAVAAAPVLASDASFDAKVGERKAVETAAAKANHECHCQHAALPAVNLPTADGARNNS